MPKILFQAAGTLRAAYESVPWARTALGPVESWSPALRTALDLVLQTRFPVTLLWGPSFVLLYNEAYVELIAEKHPSALGAPAHEVFAEAWDTIGPMMEGVLAGHGATWVRDAALPLRRNGFLEECYFTFSYSAVRDQRGTIEGVLDIAAETTDDVIGRRRLALLARLGEGLTHVERAEDIPDRAIRLLGADAADIRSVDVRVPGAPSTGGDPRLPARPVSSPRGGHLAVEETPAGRIAWVPLPTRTIPLGPGVMVVALSDRLAPDAGYLGFLRLVGGLIAEALDRAGAREGERGISETLQRSLLTTPPRQERLDVGVRYEPAAEQASVGGDWYDAFERPDGTLSLVIGDVAGHDRHAAAAMAQVRNLLRGIAYSLREPPAHVLASLDGAMLGLGVDVFATAVLAQLGPPAADGGRVLRWSNAGHPPPVLLGPDGGTRLLEGPRDQLLGLSRVERTDHAVTLEPGAAVVLYTDGLVERRGVPLDESLAWLTGALRGRQDLGAEALCDHLMAQVDRVDDDIALLALRVEPD